MNVTYDMRNTSRLVFLVGSGISIPAELPSTKQLTETAKEVKEGIEEGKKVNASGATAKEEVAESMEAT